jgi:hypothetical protein
MWRKGTEKSRNMQILLIELEYVFEEVVEISRKKWKNSILLCHNNPNH